MTEYIFGLALLVFILVTVWFNHPAPSVNGLHPVEEKGAHFHGIRSKGDGDGTYDATAHAPDGSIISGRFIADDDRLFITKPADDSAHVSLTFTPDYYLFDATRFDLGAWSGYFNRSDGGASASNRADRFQAGLRYSPARLLYGTVAPDLVLSSDLVGGGISFYPPRKLAGRYFEHVGVGAWYCAPFDGSNPGWSFGFSFSAL